MAIVNTDRLNTFWKEGVLPIRQNVSAHTLTITQLQEAVGAEQDNIDMLEAAISALQNGGSGVGGILSAYIRENSTPLSSTWLSEEGEDGDALTPQTNILYVIMTEGDYYKKVYRYNSSTTSYELATVSGGSSVGGGIVNAYTRTGATPLSSTWLSSTGASGSALTPQSDVLYVVVSAGDYYNKTYRYNSTDEEYELISGASTATGGGIVKAYIRTGSTAQSALWLSATGADGNALTPDVDTLYVVITSGDYYNKTYRYNSTDEEYQLVGDGSGGTGVGGGVINTYIRTGSTALSSGWLSTTGADGSALTPQDDVLYVVLTSGDYCGRVYRWDTTDEEYAPIKGVGGGDGDDEEIDLESAINETINELNNLLGVIFTSDTLGNQRDGFSIKWKVMDPDEDTYSVAVTLDDVSIQTVASVTLGTEYTTTLTTSQVRALTEGTHTIKVTATGTNNNELVGSQVFTNNFLVGRFVFEDADMGEKDDDFQIVLQMIDNDGWTGTFDMYLDDDEYAFVNGVSASEDEPTLFGFNMEYVEDAANGTTHTVKAVMRDSDDDATNNPQHTISFKKVASTFSVYPGDSNIGTIIGTATKHFTITNPDGNDTVVTVILDPGVNPTILLNEQTVESGGEIEFTLPEVTAGLHAILIVMHDETTGRYSKHATLYTCQLASAS